jgi:hypothetical protein
VLERLRPALGVPGQFNRAVEHEIGVPATPKGKAVRVTLPLIARDAMPTVLVTNEDIEDTFGAADVERFTAQGNWYTLASGWLPSQSKICLTSEVNLLSVSSSMAMTLEDDRCDLPSCPVPTGRA